MKLISRQKPSGKPRGFTLIEVVIVIALAGILFVTAFIKMSEGNRDVQVMAAAHKLVADLQFAQETAMAVGREVRVHFDLGNNRYYLTWADDTYLKAPPGYQDFIVQFGTGDYGTVVLASTQISGGVLHFRPDGSPEDSGGPLAQACVAASVNSMYNILIQPQTGSLTLNKVG